MQMKYRISRSDNLRTSDALNVCQASATFLQARERIMQHQSSSAPHSNSVIGYATMHACAIAALPCPAAQDRTRYRDPHLRKALSEDPRRILIVAEVRTATQIAALVHSIGRFETRAARSADVALGIARCFCPNIVLMSTDLPDLDSHRLASALRWNSTLPAARLIGLISPADDIHGSDRGGTLQAVFEQCLSLPVQSSALESALASDAGRLGGRHVRDTRRLRPK